MNYHVDPLLAEVEEQFGAPGKKGLWFIGIAAAVAGLASAASGIIGSDASSTAAGQQTAALGSGINQLNTNFDTTKNNLAPYLNFGANTALPDFTKQIGAATAPLPQSLTPAGMFNPQTLDQTPGYQFTLNQGLKGIQNGYAAQGLGSSGAAIKGAQDYTTGLASNTYNQQLQNYLANQGQQFSQGATINSQSLQQNNQNNNLLLSALGLGNQSALGLGQLSNSNSQAIANLLAGIGNANAAGTVGQANAISGGLGGIANAGNQYAVLNALTGKQSGSANSTLAALGAAS